MGLSKKQDTFREYTQIRRTTCRNCPTGCGLKVFLCHDSIVDIFGDELHPINKGALCPKALLGYSHLNHPHRIVHPLIRNNINEPFQTVTWDDALSFMARKD